MVRNSYTITLILKAFFEGFKSRAKISINDNIKTISDLEQKITNIFGIRNFHLVCDDNWLPSFEDAAILKSGDSVWAVPDDAKLEIRKLDKEFYVDPHEDIEPENRKRKSTLQYPLKEKKCKKKKKSCMSIDSDEPKLQCKIPSKKSKKNKVQNAGTEENENKQQDKEGTMLVLDTQHFKKKNILSNKCMICDMYTSTPNEQNESGLDFLQLENHKTDVPNTPKLKKKHKNSKSEINSEDVMKAKNSPSKTIEMNDDFQTNNSEHSTQMNENISGNSKNGKIEKMAVDSSSSDSELEGGLPKFEVIHKLNSENDAEARSSCTESTNIESDIQSKMPLITETTRNKLNVNGDSNLIVIEKRNKSIAAVTKIKKNKTSWSTSPLSKTTNHVQICKLPIKNFEIDLKKFVFKSSDAGVVPIPSSNENEEITSVQNQFENSSISFKNMRECKTSFEDVCSNDSKLSSVRKEINSRINETNKTDPNQIDNSLIFLKNCTNYKTSFEDAITDDSKLISGCEKLDSAINQSDKIENISSSLNDDSTNTKFKVELENSRHTSLKTLEAGTVECQPQKEMTSLNEGKSDDSKSHCKSSKISDLSSNSKRIQRRVNKQFNSVGYYLKLLDKINWDLSKSISTVDDLDSQIDSNNLKNISSNLGEDTDEAIVSEGLDQDKSAECKICVENFKAPSESHLETESSECMDSISSASIGDFVTKRKRKRSRRKNVRVATPIPKVFSKTFHMKPSKIPVIGSGTPKIHIRFENQEDHVEHIDAAAVQENPQSNSTNENIIILQNISINSEDPENEISASIELNSNEKKLLADLKDEEKLQTGLLKESITAYDRDFDEPGLLNIDEANCDESHNNNNTKKFVYNQKNTLIETADSVSEFKSLEFAKASLLQQIDCMHNLEVEDNISCITVDSDDSYMK